MYAYHFPAFRAFPLFLLVFQELPYAKLPDIFKVFDHAHAIFGSVPLVEMFQPVAGKAVAAETETGFGGNQLFAVFDTAEGAGFLFGVNVNPAAGTRILFPYICHAEAAVHPAGSDQFRGYSG
jgi:hypothetical protein